MTVKEAKEILKNYNHWRCGQDIAQPDPSLITDAINFVLDCLENPVYKGFEYYSFLNNERVYKSIKDGCLWYESEVINIEDLLKEHYQKGWEAAMELNKSIQKAKPSMDKIDNVDEFINEIKGT